MEYFAGRAATGFAIPEWLPIPDNVQYNRAVSDLEGIVYNIIARRRSQAAQHEAAEVGSTYHHTCLSFSVSNLRLNAAYSSLKLSSMLPANCEALISGIQSGEVSQPYEAILLGPLH